MTSQQFDLEHMDRNAISTLLLVNPKTIDNYVNLLDNPLPFTMKGKVREYRWPDVLEWWIYKHSSRMRTTEAKATLEAAKIEGQNLSNEKAAIELDVRKGSLLEASDVLKTWSDALVMIRQSLLNTGHTCAGEIEDGMKHSTKKKIIDSRIFSALNTVIENVENAETIPETIPETIQTIPEKIEKIEKPVKKNKMS